MTSILYRSKRVFNATNSNAIISKAKNICWTLFWISESYIKFEILWKKRWASKGIFFWNYRLPRVGLLKWRKSPVSEHVSTVNMLKCPKDRLNLHSSIFSHIFLSLWNKIYSKKFVLVVFEILRLFVKILTPDDKYSLSVKPSV